MSAPAISPAQRRLTADEQIRIRELLAFIATEIPPLAGIHVTTLRRSLAPYPEAAGLRVKMDLQVLPLDGPISTSAGGLTNLEGRTGNSSEGATEHVRNALQMLGAFTAGIPERDPHGAYYCVRAADLDALRDRLEAALDAEFGR